MASVSIINRFNNPLTQQFLAKNAVSLRAYGAFGSQQSLGTVSGDTQYNLSSLYNGQNPFLPGISVNGSNNSDALTRFYTSSGSGGITSSSSAKSVGSTNLSLSFDSNGRAVFGRNTNPTSPNLPEAFSNTWIAQRALSEANLTALLSDPSNTTINLTRLGLTIESDGAGNIVNVRDSLNITEVTPFNSPPNTAEFPLRNPLQFGTGADLTPQTAPTGSPQQATNQNPLNALSPRATILPPTNSADALNRSALFGTSNAGITDDAGLQQALLARVSQRQATTQPVDTTLTGPNATVGLEQLQTLKGVNPFANAAHVGTLHQQQLAQAAASQYYAPATTPAERNGIIPLVQPEMPMRRLGSAGGSASTSSHQGFDLGAQVDVDAGGQKGAGLMFQLGANLGGGGGSNASSQGQSFGFGSQGQRPGQGSAGHTNGQRKKMPLSFMA